MATRTRLASNRNLHQQKYKHMYCVLSYNSTIEHRDSGTVRGCRKYKLINNIMFKMCFKFSTWKKNKYVIPALQHCSCFMYMIRNHHNLSSLSIISLSTFDMSKHAMLERSQSQSAESTLVNLKQVLTPEEDP